jgi:hypothetical protein
MKIQEWLPMILAHNFLEQAKNLLGKAEGCVNWFGHKVITVKDFEGEIKIADFIRDYLKPLHREDLKGRLEGIHLVERVMVLNFQAENALKKSWVVQYIPAAFNFLGAEATGLHERTDLENVEDTLCEFSKDEFIKRFGECQPKAKRVYLSGHHTQETWVVEKSKLLELYSMV